ncbi:hypothetical protein [Algoriphagus jejuensis]|uniref:hypothetical protein n=1 Tax=Algoriphagus jejuensis TaxID=419934 RepID=UPI0031DA287C
MNNESEISSYRIFKGQLIEVPKYGGTIVKNLNQYACCLKRDFKLFEKSRESIVLPFLDGISGVFFTRKWAFLGNHEIQARNNCTLVVTSVFASGIIMQQNHPWLNFNSERYIKFFRELKRLWYGYFLSDPVKRKHIAVSQHQRYHPKNSPKHLTHVTNH